MTWRELFERIAGWWYVPTIDAMQVAMLREINSLRPLYVRKLSANGTRVFKAVSARGWSRLAAKAVDVMDGRGLFGSVIEDFSAGYITMGQAHKMVMRSVQ